MCLLNFVCITTQTQHALWKYRESPILLRILLQPFLGLGNQAIVGRIVLQLFANGVAVGMVENHTRKLRPAGLQRPGLLMNGRKNKLASGSNHRCMVIMPEFTTPGSAQFTRNRPAHSSARYMA